VAAIEHHATAALIKASLKIVRLITHQALSVHFERFEVRSPIHRFASRTSLLEAALDDLLFKGASLKDLPAQPHLVIKSGSTPRSKESPLIRSW
jgi:NTE family protein